MDVARGCRSQSSLFRTRLSPEHGRQASRKGKYVNALAGGRLHQPAEGQAKGRSADRAKL